MSIKEGNFKLLPFPVTYSLNININKNHYQTYQDAVTMLNK